MLLWDLEDTGADPARLLSDHEDDVVALAFSPDGRWLATGSLDGTARVVGHGGPGGRPSKPREATKGKFRTLAFSPDGRWIATRQHRYHHSDLGSQTTRVPVAHVLEPKAGSILCLAFSPDGRLPSVVPATARS